MISRIIKYVVPPAISLLIVLTLFELENSIHDNLLRSSSGSKEHFNRQPQLVVFIGVLIVALVIQVIFIVPLWSERENNQFKDSNPGFWYAAGFLCIVTGILFGSFFSRQEAGITDFLETSLLGIVIPVIYFILNFLILYLLGKKFK